MAIGDHLFVDCGKYSHHGIQTGDDEVIHFDFRPADKCRSLVGRRVNSAIRKSTIQEFAGGEKIFVRRYATADDTNLVLERANSRLGESGYCLLFNNCEHFAQWCKTGKRQSTQVEAARSASVPLVTGVFAGAALRVLPMISPPFRLAVGTAAVASSIAAATRKYLHRRRWDRASHRS